MLVIKCDNQNTNDTQIRLLKWKRETRAAIRIQSAWRGCVERRRYVGMRRTLIKIQTIARGYLARQKRAWLLRNRSAIVIQAHVRGWIIRRLYQRIVRGIVMLQAHVRRRQARKLFKSLKIEARSVEHQRQLNKGLENKIISLQQHIEKMVRTLPLPFTHIP